MHTISTGHNPDRQNYLFRSARQEEQSLLSGIQAEDIGLVLKEHEPVRTKYNPTATCSSRTIYYIKKISGWI